MNLKKVLNFTNLKIKLISLLYGLVCHVAFAISGLCMFWVLYNGLTVSLGFARHPLSIFINIGAITLWPFVISRNKLNEQVLNHETIHIKQQQELLIIGFYILYVYYWIKGLMYYRDTEMAYYSIPFEMEAYDHDENLEYLNKRKFMAWWKYR